MFLSASKSILLFSLPNELGAINISSRDSRGKQFPHLVIKEIQMALIRIEFTDVETP